MLFWMLIFLAAALVIAPLAGWLGQATEQLAERSGEGVGGSLTPPLATPLSWSFALSALRAGLHDVVKASLVGSIVGNILLVLGASMLAGGLRQKEQHCNASAARSQVAMATLVIAWISEILVSVIEPSARQLGLSNLFVGVFIVAILGNAAEHSSAISAAMKNRMDLSLSIAIGSSVQVALFVAPVLVLASYAIGSVAMDLAFFGGLVLSVLLAVLITGQVAGDGRSDWLKGVQLIAVYLILGLAYFFTPDIPN